MKKNLYTLLSISILTALYSQSSWGNLQEQCLSGVPHFSGEVTQGNLNELPVEIEANNAEITPISAKYDGNVEVKQGNRSLNANSLSVLRDGKEQRMAEVSNGFKYKDTLIQLEGNSAKINLNNKDSWGENVDYQFVNRQGRGKANSVESNAKERKMKNATFTSCLPNDESWSIEAKEIRQDIEGEYAEMWHARFKIHGVPVFYTPYFQLPLGNRRRSGMLIPSVGTSSRDGYYYEQPIYWNIATNMDATFTPKYMSKRGWQLNTEFRYLTPFGEGTLAGEYIHRDRLKDYVDNNRSRHLFYWTHNSSFLENWRLDLDYTRVSDEFYFTDFNSKYGASTDGYANQIARVAYYQPNYNVALSVKQFQIFDHVRVGPYRALPQLDFNYYKNNIRGVLDAKVFAQVSRFLNKSSVMPRAWRLHLEPSIVLPMVNRYGSMNIEAKLYASRYYQQAGSGRGGIPVKHKVDRVLPQIKFDLQTVLTTDKTFIDGYTQTIEPRLQYLYRPYQNQREIGPNLNSEYLGFGYDSALLQQDYFSLFRDHRYSGLDRIASANEITLGATSRFYDAKGEERFNLSAGQKYYFQESRIDDLQENNAGRRSSSWSLESNWKIHDNWNWKGSYQYDTRINKTSLGNTALEYRLAPNSFVQLSYRYVSKEYIDQNLTSQANSYGQSINQLGLITALELNNNWSIVARHYQDLTLRKPVDQYFGVEYRTCCWAVNLGAKRHVTSRPTQDHNRIFYDKGVSLNFELRGLGQNQHKTNIDDMLQKGKLPYLQAFTL